MLKIMNPILWLHSDTKRTKLALQENSGTENLINQGVPFQIILEASLFSDSQLTLFMGGKRVNNISHIKVQPQMITLSL